MLRDVVSFTFSCMGVPSSYIGIFTIVGPRVRGIKVKLLTRDQLRSLIYAETVDDFLTALRETPYKLVAEKYSKEIPPAEFARDVASLVVSDVLSIMRSAPLTVRPVLSAFLLKYEIDNIKLIAKGLFERKERKEVERWVNVYVEEVLGRRHVLAYLLSASDLEDLGAKLKELAHPAAAVFESIILKLIKARPSLAPCIIDTLLDKIIIERLIELSSGLLARESSLNYVLKSVSDYYNLNILLRGRLWGLPLELANEFVVKFGLVGTSFAKYYEETIVRVIDELAPQVMPIKVLMGMIRITEVEHAVEHLSLAMYKSLQQLLSSTISRYSEFSPGAALAASFLKDVEANIVVTLANTYVERVPRDLVKKYFGAIL